MANSKLQMPANYMALNESEMSCVEGGGIISQVCYAFGRMFRSTYYDKWESESKTLEQSHGAVVSKKNGVSIYTVFLGNDSPMVLSFPRKTVYILTPMVIPTQCLVAATGALPVSVTSSMESAICSLHSICKF